MPAGRQWRTARFRTDELRAEFIAHARELHIDGLEVERTAGQVEVRFRAPAEVEVGIAQMIGAHGGKVIPALVEPQPVGFVSESALGDLEVISTDVETEVEPECVEIVVYGVSCEEIVGEVELDVSRVAAGADKQREARARRY